MEVADFFFEVFYFFFSEDGIVDFFGRFAVGATVFFWAFY